MLLPVQAPPVVRDVVGGSCSASTAGVRPAAPDFEIDWKCKKLKANANATEVEPVLAYNIKDGSTGADKGWVWTTYECVK